MATRVKPPIAAARHAKSWMGAGAKSQDLLYVTNANGLVNVYRYNQHTLFGVLTDFKQPMGECVDKAGDVYITDYQAQIISEYAHGGAKPIATIKDQYEPYDCAIDPKTGNLAVANFGVAYSIRPRTSSDGGNIAIYPHARGKPTYYGGGDEHFTACGYDKYGDLLAESLTQISSYYYGAFYYLPARSNDFATISIPAPTSSWEWGKVEKIAWDGEYWVIDDYGLYRYNINIKVQYVGEVSLSESGGDLGPVWVYQRTPKSLGTQVVATSIEDSRKGYLTYWKYPAGGDPIYQTTKYLDLPYGVAVSLKT